MISNIPVRRNWNGPFNLNSNRKFRNLWHNGKHPTFSLISFVILNFLSFSSFIACFLKSPQKRFLYWWTSEAGSRNVFCSPERKWAFWHVASYVWGTLIYKKRQFSIWWTFNIISWVIEDTGLQDTFFFWSTLTKDNLKKENMQQLNPDKIVLNLIFTLSKKTKTLLKIFAQNWVQDAVSVIEDKMFAVSLFCLSVEVAGFLPLLSLWLPKNSRRCFQTLRANMIQKTRN